MPVSEDLWPQPYLDAYTTAVEAMFQHEFETAEALLRKAIDDLPSFALCRILLGVNLHQLGKEEEAAKEIQQVTAHDRPDFEVWSWQIDFANEVVRFMLTKHLDNREILERLLGACTQLRKLHPDDPLWVGIMTSFHARALAALGMNELARQEFELADKFLSVSDERSIAVAQYNNTLHWYALLATCRKLASAKERKTLLLLLVSRHKPCGQSYSYDWELIRRLQSCFMFVRNRAANNIASW